MVRRALLASLFLSACAARTPAPPAPSAPPTTAGAPSGPVCVEAERHGLDFWIGDWDLVVKTRKAGSESAWDEARGVSAIRAVLGGCAIEENFHADGPGAPWAGRSFSTYVPGAKTWRQTWVDDSGGYLSFTGGPDDGGVALYGESRDVGGKRVRMRMVFREITAGGLFWSWERGTEPATDWTPVMTIRYSRRPAAPAGVACDADPTFHDLDFWLGHWRVTSDGKEVGTNRIEKMLAGCALVERWKDADGSDGESLFFHPPGSSTWKQVWVSTQATSIGGAKEKQLVGRGADGSYRFQGELPLPGGKVLLDRTTLTPLPNGRVHQVIEVSRDIGAHWKTTFDAIYERM